MPDRDIQLESWVPDLGLRLGGEAAKPGPLTIKHGRYHTTARCRSSRFKDTHDDLGFPL